MAQEVPDIDISGNGIKLSYRRYLSDSSAGFLLLLVLIVSNLNTIKEMGKDLPSEVLLLMSLLLFLLATPVGLFINVTSWYLLEGEQDKLERRIVAEDRKTIKRPGSTIEMLKTEYMFAECQQVYGFADANWRSSYERNRAQLEIKYPGIVAAAEPVRGITIFLRNLVLLVTLGLFIGVISILVDAVNAGSVESLSLIPFYLLMFIFPFLLLRLSSLTAFYYHLQIVFWAYTLGLRYKNGKPVWPTGKEKENKKR